LNLDALVPPRFLERVPFERLAHLPRHVQALMIRADRASLNRVKDAEKWSRIEPFARAYAGFWRPVLSETLIRAATRSNSGFCMIFSGIPTFRPVMVSQHHWVRSTTMALATIHATT